MSKIKKITPALKGDLFLPAVRLGFFGLPSGFRVTRKIKMN